MSYRTLKRNVIRCIKKKFENKEHVDLKRKIKFFFRTFFEGYVDEVDFYIEPTIKMELCKLEITDLSFKFKKDYIQLTVTLGRPGLLVGRYGSTIDNLMSSLTSYVGKKVKIYIIESKLWNC